MGYQLFEFDTKVGVFLETPLIFPSFFTTYLKNILI